MLFLLTFFQIPFGSLHQDLGFLYDMVVGVPVMRNDAARAVLDPFFVLVAVLSSALRPQSIERTKAEKAVEVFLRDSLMAGKPFAFLMLRKCIVLRLRHDKFLLSHLILLFCSFAPDAKKRIPNTAGPEQ